MLHLSLRHVASILFTLALAMFALPSIASDSGPGWRSQWLIQPMQIEGGQVLDAAGNSIPLAQWQGKPTLLNFWARWCPPCIFELPEMQKVHQKYQNHLNLAAISVDRKGFEIITPFLAENGLTALPAYSDPQSTLYRALQVRVLPSTLILNAKGELIGRIEGVPPWDDAFMQMLLDKLQKAQ